MFGFGKALDVLRDGDAVTRAAWRSTETFVPSVPHVKLVPGKVFPVVVRSGLDEDFIEPWAPTQADLLAEDWDYAR